MRRTPALLLLLALACTKGDPAPAPSGDPEAAARGRLAVLAQKTADGQYDATYRFVQLPSNASGTIRIRQVPPQYRIDVTSKGTASFLSLHTGVVSCTVKPQGSSCFLVAKPGEEVPPLFDPGVQRLFRDAVEELAKNPTDYRVAEVTPPATPSGSASPTLTATATATATPTATATATATATPAAGASPSASAAPLPPGTCFSVERLSTPSPGTVAAGFENGTYCFAEQGVATRIEVQSGVLELVALGGIPNSTWFAPPARVQQLPALTPTPTPTR